MRMRIAILIVLLSSSSGVAASGLGPRDRAVVIAARHLLVGIGTPALAAAVRDRSLRSDDYWRAVFRDAGEPDLFPLIEQELHRAMNDVPLVNGRPAEPDVFARAVLRGIGPMPMKPLNEAPEAERRSVLSFARTDLAALSRTMYERPAEGPAAAKRAAVRARAVFGSGAIAGAFERMGLLLDGRDETRVELADTKDRLNEYLHPFGLHLVLDASDLSRGRANLASYVILSRHAFNILGKPFVVYEARPAVDAHTTSALGHAEIEPGYMFIFANHADRETEAGVSFAKGRPLSALWGTPDGRSPLAGLTGSGAASIESAVRRRLVEGQAAAPAAYRGLLITTIGRHEGFHMYIESGIAQAVRRGKISRSMSGSWHENGAYLYQLEMGDPAFVHMDLLMLLIVAMSGDPRFPDNTAGARAALGDLQAYVKEFRFWDAAEHRPDEAGLVRLFELEPDAIRKAASQARWSYEVAVRN